MRELPLGEIVKFDTEENKRFDWSDLVSGNKQVLEAFYPHEIESVERSSGVQVFLVNGYDYIFVSDDSLIRLGYKTDTGKMIA